MSEFQHELFFSFNYGYNIKSGGNDVNEIYIYVREFKEVLASKRCANIT